MSVRVSLTETEARELVEGRVPESVRIKLVPKLAPPVPIPGQIDVYGATHV